VVYVCGNPLPAGTSLAQAALRAWTVGLIPNAACGAVQNEAAPTISGNPQPGGTLSASPGSWTSTCFPLASFSYVWDNGATGPVIDVGAGDVVATRFVTVTACNTEGDCAAASSAGLTIQPGPQPAAVAVGVPLAAAMQVGGADQVLSASSAQSASTATVPASVAGGSPQVAPHAIPCGMQNSSAPLVSATGLTPGSSASTTTGRFNTLGCTSVTFTFQWLRDGAEVASGQNYVLQPADVGTSITSFVTACGTDPFDGEVCTGVASSNALFPVPPPPPPCSGPPANTDAPSIAGGNTVGSTLSVLSNGGWLNGANCAAITFTYQWERDGVAIAGETGTSYLVHSGDVGGSLILEVFASNDVGGTEAVSNAIAIAANDPPLTPSGLFRPSAGDVIDGAAGDVFDATYSDPNGDTGSIAYTILDSNGSPATTPDPLVGPTVVSGANSPVTLPNALPEGVYTWSAVATDDLGLPSAPSDPVSFLVDHAPATPGLLSPADQAVVPTVAPTLTVEQSSDSDPVAYQFSISTTPGDCLTGGNISDWLSGTPSWTPANLSDGTSYWWCARAQDDVVRAQGTNVSDWSAPRELSIQLP
jgi:hypothetical protein